ncbi:MAG: AtpZ/AtpI family protein [Actinomycetia bacterium]|nr:AtpZ/AtpI family protein [Actinomycetes bacterium]
MTNNNNNARRELNNGFGDSLSRAFELAVTPGVFAGAGYLVDRLLGTVAVFTITLMILAVIGELVLWWYRYDHKMSQLEAELVAKRSAVREGDERVIQSVGQVKAPAPIDMRLPTGVTLDDRFDLGDVR